MGANIGYLISIGITAYRLFIAGALMPVAPRLHAPAVLHWR